MYIRYSIHTHAYVSTNVYSHTKRARPLIFHKGLPASKTALWQDRFQMSYSKFKTGNKAKRIKSLHVKFCHHVGQWLHSARRRPVRSAGLVTPSHQRGPGQTVRGSRLLLSALAPLPTAASITHGTVNSSTPAQHAHQTAATGTLQCCRLLRQTKRRI